jgi:hypothetical protein
MMKQKLRFLKLRLVSKFHQSTTHAESCTTGGSLSVPRLYHCGTSAIPLGGRCARAASSPASVRSPASALPPGGPGPDTPAPSSYVLPRAELAAHECMF